MELHTLTNSPGAKRPRKRIGRGTGSGTGKTSGHGHKGQMARKGHKRKLGFEGGQMRLVRRIPKRGFTNPCREEMTPVNLDALASFGNGAEVTAEALRLRGLVKGRNAIKILGRGELNIKLTVKARAFSASARAKIEAAGGTCEVMES